MGSRQETTIVEQTEHFVEWKPFYSVGDAGLDNEHKVLLGILDDLYLAVQMGHSQHRVQIIVDRLAEYTMTHFEHEEHMMQSCGYPNLEAHKIMHDEMRRRTLEFQANTNAITEGDLLQFLKSWWVRHIQNQDKTYAPYIAVMIRQPIKMA
jgi:hemerythrin